MTNQPSSRGGLAVAAALCLVAAPLFQGPLGSAAGGEGPAAAAEPSPATEPDPAAQAAEERAGRGRRAVAALPAGVAPPDRWAVVIDVCEFEDERLPDVRPRSAEDPAGIYEALTDPAGGMFPEDHVTLLDGPDVARRDVVIALAQVTRRAGPQDLVVLYFRGLETSDELNRTCWVMADTDPHDMRRTALPLERVADALDDLATDRVLVLTDTVLGLEFEPGLPDDKEARRRRDPALEELAGSRRFAVCSSDDGRMSAPITDEDHPGHGHSVFAWHVMRGLRGEADDDEPTGDRDADLRGGVGVVDAMELWQYVKDHATEAAWREGATQQSPRSSGGTNLGDDPYLLGVNADRLLDVASDGDEAGAE